MPIAGKGESPVEADAIKEGKQDMVQVATADAATPIGHPGTRKPCYVFDIDGTLADCSHRLHLIQQTPKDWRAFFARCGNDAPIAHMLKIAETLSCDTDVIFVSGRSDECRTQTLEWLTRHMPGLSLTRDDLYMRRGGDHRDDDIVKMELLAHLRADAWEPIMVFEDRKRVVDAWRAAGIPCAQVAVGDF